jgi:para-nitrobenzyl esterase
MKISFRGLFLVALMTAGILSFRIPGESLDIIKTDAGAISGLRNDQGDIRIFKGIPFAAPPVGALRWKAPQPVTPWKGVRKCLAFGPSPMQAKPAPFAMWTEEYLIPKEPIGEDCLYLNVWTGARSAKDKRPVLVWIYGGGFVSGGSAVPIYDGEAMAKKGVIFVSINYRVGLFGFFAHPELTRESGKNASGNYALMDAIAALDWVKKNIAAFGGDPSNVTIAGQSAGSFLVNCLVASPLGKGLFQKAIGESGASFTSPYPSLQKAEEDGLLLGKSLNANTLADLRNLPADVIQKKTQGLRGPIIDGYVLPYSIGDIFSKGGENKVSLITGWNEDEGIMFGPKRPAESYVKDVHEKYGADASTALAYFPGDNDSIAAVSQMRLARDGTFGVQNYAWASQQSGNGAKVFVYRFARRLPAGPGAPDYGAFHTGEVPYAYNNLRFVHRPWKDGDYKLADIMSSYWTNFAKTGDPNGKGLPEWPGFNRRDKMILQLNDPCFAEKLPDADALDFLFKKMTAR